MNVLSLFDGISCGRIALERAGVRVDKYFAAEVDKYAIQITKKNYPDTIHIGDVTEVYSFELPEIDLLLGGSPCQGFSFAGKQLAFDDPRSKLFFEFVRILKEVKPKYFLLENVRMKKEHRDVITEHLGVEPICINSALVSAQNRVRYYWTNIPGVSQPEDKELVLKDILEVKGEAVTNNYGVFNPRKDGKSTYLTANYYKGVDNKGSRTVIITGKINKSQDGYILSSLGKSKTLTAGHSNYPKIAPAVPRSAARRGRGDEIRADQKANALLSDGHQSRWLADSVSKKMWRKLSPVECERLQTLPDNYTEGVSDTQRYKMIGNGWTVDVVAHILKGLKPVDLELEELLS